MKRVEYGRYGGPEVMAFGEHVPPALAAGLVRVRVRAAAINPLDWKLRQGAMKLMTGRRFPRTMGSDFSGVVEAIGSGVSTVQVGDEVFGTADIKRQGAFAEVVDTEARLVARKPAGLSFAEAACLPIPATTAWAAMVNVAQVGPGSRVFIHGCNGAVGSAAVQLARTYGTSVFGSCGAHSAESAKRNGAKDVFDYADKALFASSGNYDVVFDTVGSLPVSDGLAMLKPKGRFLDINPSPGRVLRGIVSGRYRMVFSTMGYRNLQDIAVAAGQGALRPTVAREVPFAEALDVIGEVEAGRRPPGRIVLLM